MEPLFDARDVFRTLTRLQAVKYGNRVSVSKGVEATFVDAGHLLGSAMVSVHIGTPAGVRRLTFTGDVGRPGLPILRDPEPVPPCDLLISESTYGGHTHEHVDETAEKLGEVVRRTAEGGGADHHPGVRRRPHPDGDLLPPPVDPRREVAGRPDLRGQPDGDARE